MHTNDVSLQVRGNFFPSASFHHKVLYLYPMSKEPSHVAVYLNSLFNGGIEKPLFHLMQGLISRGIKVDLVLDYLTYSPFEALIPESTRVIKFGVRSLPSRLSALSRYLREEKPDAMLAGSRLEVRKVERGKPNTSHIPHQTCTGRAGSPKSKHDEYGLDSHRARRRNASDSLEGALDLLAKRRLDQGLTPRPERCHIF